jgi:hypothetical protein
MPENGWAMVWRRSDQYCRLPGIKKKPKNKEKIKNVRFNQTYLHLFFGSSSNDMRSPKQAGGLFLFLDIIPLEV